MQSKWSNEKENLIDLIYNQKKSYEEIGRIYKCSGNNIKKIAKTLKSFLKLLVKMNIL